MSKDVTHNSTGVSYALRHRRQIKDVESADKRRGSEGGAMSLIDWQRNSLDKYLIATEAVRMFHES